VLADLTPRQAAVFLLATKLSLRHAISSRRDSNVIHCAADAHYRPMLLAVSASFMCGRKAYKSGGTSAAVKAIRASLLKDLPPVLAKVFVAGANAGVGMLPKKRVAEMRALKPQVKGQPHSTIGPLNLAFNVTDPNAIEWADEHAAELAKNLSATSEQAIKDAVAAALAGDGLDAAYDDILAAVGDSARADMIARTEIMTAANEGNRQGWDQAVTKGLLPADAEVEWIAASDCCDDCAELDGTRRTLDGEYDNDGGDGPPLHPQCRCTEGIAG
jgi:hypothetical protein